MAGNAWRVNTSLAVLFFAICIGIGFSSVQRYDPRSVKGLGDSRSYVAMMQGRDAVPPMHSLRILVPALARPIAQLSRGRVGSWSPEFLGLLIVNSVFISLAALFLVLIGEITVDRITGLVAGLLYLLTFNVSSLYLDGLVDSPEAFGVIVLVWLIMTRRWTWIPIAGFIAALGKETSVPIMLVMCATWLIQSRHDRSIRTTGVILVSLLAAQLAAIVLSESIASGSLGIPWHVGALAHASSVTSADRLATILNREWLYSFAWLVPFAIPRLRQMPSEWCTASAASFAIALALGLLLGVGGNVVRPTFNAIAPLLIVSASAYLTGMLRSSDPVLTSS